MIYGRKKIVEQEYYNCVKDILENDDIKKLRKYYQHGNTTRFEHSLNVSYLNYKICKNLGLDYKSAARAGLLHDFFLYDWKQYKEKDFFKKHGFCHPKTALRNSEQFFKLNDIEKDMILKHMWPLTIKLPKYKETYVITFVDKACCLHEMAKALKVTMFIKSIFE